MLKLPQQLKFSNKYNMTIYKPDGSIFQPRGSLTQFNQNNPAFNLFNRWDSEVIELYGSPVFYYEVLIQTATMDRLYNEDRTQLKNPDPIRFYAYYEPIEPQNPSTAFGIDGVGDVLFECNYEAVINAIGHVPKRGSRIQTPHFNEFWIVVDTRRTQFQLWGAFHLQIICERYQETVTLDEGQSPPVPEYNLSF